MQVFRPNSPNLLEFVDFTADSTSVKLQSVNMLLSIVNDMSLESAMVSRIVLDLSQCYNLSKSFSTKTIIESGSHIFCGLFTW